MASALLVVSAALIWIGAWLPVALWFLALVTVFWSLNRIRGWTEHVGLPPGHTRLKLEPPLWQRWLRTLVGIWAHVEHHRYPMVPSRKLTRRQ